MVINHKWTPVKSPDDIKLNIAVELEWSGSYITGITLTDSQGDRLRIAKHGYSDDLKVLVPEMVEKHRVSGTVYGATFQQDFDSSLEALNCCTDLTNSLGETAVLSVDRVRVPA